MRRSPTPKQSAASFARRKQPALKTHAGVLRRLEQVQLVRRLAESEPTFIFKNALTQESAYGSLLHSTRRRIHLDVARTYESLYADRLDEYAALLAQHYVEGGNDKKALEYATRAGDAARRVYSNSEAIAHYSRALEIALRVHAEGSLVTKLYLQRGRIHELDGHYEDALDDYRALHAAARARSDRAMELASVMATLPVYATPTTAHDPDMAKMLADRALTLARKLKDPAAESKILWSLMLFTRWTGDPAESVKYGEQSLEIAREHNVREQIAYTLNDLGVHGYLDTGDFIKALESLTEAQEMWRAQNNLPMLADSYSGIALLSYPLGKFDQAIAAGEQARQISESIENLWGQSYARWIMGNVYADRGEPARAIEVMEECIRLGERAGFGGAEVGVRNLLAAVCLEYGLLERALQAAAMSLKIANERMAAWAPWSHAVYALALVRAGELERAKAEIAFTTGGSSKFFRGRIMALMWFNLVLSQASMALATNARNKSLLDLNQLVDFLFEHKAIALVPDALLARAHILISEEKLDAAYEVLARAREIAEPLSHRRTLWQTYALLEQIETRRENLGAAQEWRDKARVVVGYITAHATKEQHAAFLEMDLVRQVTS